MAVRNSDRVSDSPFSDRDLRVMREKLLDVLPHGVIFSMFAGIYYRLLSGAERLQL